MEKHGKISEEQTRVNKLNENSEINNSKMNFQFESNIKNKEEILIHTDYSETAFNRAKLTNKSNSKVERDLNESVLPQFYCGSKNLIPQEKSVNLSIIEENNNNYSKEEKCIKDQKNLNNLLLNNPKENNSRVSKIKINDKNPNFKSDLDIKINNKNNSQNSQNSPDSNRKMFYDLNKQENEYKISKFHNNCPIYLDTDKVKSNSLVI